METIRPRRRRRKAGFTLMEILLVLAILVILGGTVTFYFAKIQSGAYADTARTQLQNFKSMLQLYRIHVGSHPSNAQGLEALRTAPPDISNPAKWQGPYLKEELPKDPWDQDYQYKQTADGFEIWSMGADMTDGTDDDIRVQG